MLSKIVTYISLLIFSVTSFCKMGAAQPVIFNKLIIEDLEIYRDLNKPNLYYYAPGDLNLKMDGTGKPQFQLLQMRYTGTKLASTSGEKRFTNIVQFSVKMDKVKPSKLKSVKDKLDRGVSLRPLPIKNVEANIVIPSVYIDDNNDVILDGTSSSQTTGSSAQNKSTYWTERTFTLRLENYGAQLLWNLLEQKQLAISITYAFSADMIASYKGELIAEGDSTFLEQVDDMDNTLGIDSLVTSPVIVNSGSLSITLDLETHAELLKKIDINEALPPAYPTIEVRCYDFLEGLRPDLAMKKVQLKAWSVNDNVVEIPTVKFVQSQPDLHTYQVSSAYAISLSKPLSYKVISITKEGVKQETDWVQLAGWGAIIDVTTPTAELLLDQKKITFEFGLEQIETLHIIKVNLYIEYYQHQQKRANTITIYPNKQQFYEADLKYDKDTDIRYQLIWWDADSLKNVSRKKSVYDDYYYLRFGG